MLDLSTLSFAKIASYAARRHLPKFKGRVLFIGFGGVAKCVLPVLIEHLSFDLKRTTVIDMLDKREPLRPYIGDGLTFIQLKIDEKNLEKTIATYAGAGDLVIDLAYNIGCTDITSICNRLKAMYINTSVEQWDPYSDKLPLYQKTLYHRHMELRDALKSKKMFPNTTTAVVDHGANPGLISHFVRKGLLDIAGQILKDGNDPKLVNVLSTHDFGELAMYLGVKVIHDSEWDTQGSCKPKKQDEFVGTWSIEGFREEGCAPVEMGWGTHEEDFKKLIRPTEGPMNQAFMNRYGFHTLAKSHIPGAPTNGMMIRHGENFTISEALTVRRPQAGGKIVYRPSFYYVYCPCSDTLTSIWEFNARGCKMQDSLRFLTDEDIIYGSDTLGALIMGHKYKCWWTGTRLSIDQARRLVPGHNATTIQVAIGVTAAIMWMIENPNLKVVTPEDIPHEQILKVANPYLGDVISQSIDWEPVPGTKWMLKDFLVDPEIEKTKAPEKA